MSGAAKDITVAISYNLKKGALTQPPDAEAEFDDLGTVHAIRDALESGGYKTGLFEAEETFAPAIASYAPDIVFNIAEGKLGRGREAQIPAILSFLGIPYVGSDETTMCLAMDKALTKRLLSTLRVNTPRYKLVGKNALRSAGRTGAVPGLSHLQRPIIVKPNAEGSGKGISGVSVVTGDDELRRVLEEITELYNQDALVEEYIHGREITVGLLGNGDDAVAFTPMEIIFRDKNRCIYDYETKRDFRQRVDYACPPDLGAETINHLETTALKIFKFLNCKDFARIDFRLSPEGRLYFIELNPIPGLAPDYSDYPMLAEFCGTGYNDLIQAILSSALKRYGL